MKWHVSHRIASGPFLQLIFTATPGHSGTQNLVALFNRFGSGCLAEHEPPDLPLRQLGHLPFFRKRGWFGPNSRVALVGRSLQRRYIAPDWLVGRGEALKWVERGEVAKLSNLAARKARRIRRFERKGYSHYLEAGPYFLRTYGHQLYEVVPDLGIIKLTRDPLQNAKSFVNRNKDIWKTAIPPHRQSNILRLENWEKLSKLQLYLYVWFETELKFVDFLERHPVNKVFRLTTPELSQPKRVSEMFRYFSIEHSALNSLTPTNTASEHGTRTTVITASDVNEYHQFLELVPPAAAARIDFLNDYAPRKT